MTHDALLMRLKPAEWDRVIATNLTSAYALSRAAIGKMVRARYGRIILVSSISGLMGNPGQTAYAASKSGVIGLTKAAARELAGRNITVNAVAPGYIATRMTEKLSDEARQALMGRIPLGRLGEPRDVAEAVLFLASPASGYITGQVLCVDGGMVM